MARLSRDEITDMERRLAEWQTPAEMAALVEDAMHRLGSEDLFNQGGLAFIRDAWIACEFGNKRRAEQVRLVADEWPDFELMKDGQIEPFEAVEADDPERRRGDEYRNTTGEIEDDPVEDWIARAEQASAWLEAACQKKADKHYGARANLVAYLSFTEYGIRQKEVEKCLVSVTEAVKDSFDTVWVLWKKRAYLVWKGGEANPKGTRLQNPLEQ